MRAVAVALLLTLLGVFASEPTLAQKRGWNIPSGIKQYSGGASQPRSGGHHQGHRHGHHHHQSFVGVGFGFAYPWGWWYPPPYPYHLPIAYPQPVTYIEQSGAPAPEQPAWWYYCEASTSYYPHVRECPTGWLRVPATK